MAGELDGYLHILSRLKAPSNKSDPRTLRLAAVASVMCEAVGDSGNSMAATRVCATAVAALEGALKNQVSSLQELLDSLSTQAALLEILRVTLMYVSNRAILSESLPLTSRVLRAVVASMSAVDRDHNAQVDTKDDLGGIGTVLRGICHVSTVMMRRLESECDVKVACQLYRGTLLHLLENNRPKVRCAARNGILELVHSDNCQMIIVKVTSQYAHKKLRAALTMPYERTHRELLRLLAFLERTIHRLEGSVLVADLMELLGALLKRDTKNRKQAPAMRQTDTLNAVLSAIKEFLLYDRCNGQEEAPGDLACRVLATMLHNRSAWSFLGGSTRQKRVQRERTLYASVVIASCRRVTETNPELACKLLPLTVQAVLRLCSQDDGVDPTAEGSVLTEFVALLRLQFAPLSAAPSCQQASNHTCFAKSLQAMVDVLKPRWKPSWSASLRALVAMLEMSVNHECVPSAVCSVLQLRCSDDVDSQLAVEAAVGSLVEAVGIESFWEWVNWTGEGSGGNGLNPSLSWLLPVMKAARARGTRPHLEFFREQVLGLARRYAVIALGMEDQAAHDKWVLGLWALFPRFCERPVDQETHLKKLVPTLAKALDDKRYPQLLDTVCSGLESLSRSVRRNFKKNGGEALPQASVVLIPILFKNTERLHTVASPSDTDLLVEMSLEEQTLNASSSDLIQRTAQAIASLASHAPEVFLHGLSQKLVRRLLEEIQTGKDDTQQLCSLLNLLRSLVGSGALNETCVSFFYRATRFAIFLNQSDPKVHKISYKILSQICRFHHEYVTEGERFKEMMDLVTGTAITSHASSRSMRLFCLKCLVDGFKQGDLTNVNAITRMAGEALLCLKDRKTATRDIAYRLLTTLAKATGDLAGFLRVLASAMASETPHMRSAAVSAASRVVFEFAKEDVGVQKASLSLLSAVLLFLNEDAREVIKSSVDFVRVCVVAMPPDQLLPLVGEIVTSLLKHKKVNDRFRSKIKIIITYVVRMYGYESLPKSEQKLLVHIRKTEERTKRRRSYCCAEDIVIET